MKLFLFASLSAVSCAFAANAHAAADGLTTRNPNATVSAANSRASTAFDPAKELPRYPAVAPKDAVATWKMKPGFKIEFVTHEPQIRDPIAISFDENGRMFVCEMIDYSEERDRTPHLGRISMLEDKDGDGFYETSTVFADDLPLPTGLVWANGGLFVAASPNIWRFEDKDGDGRADVREIAFTGFGTGLKALNVQAMLNSLHWSQDNRIHVQGGPGNRGKISSPKRPDQPAEEIAGRDFWFDPRTYEFGFESGGAQYGMSFDNYGTNSPARIPTTSSSSSTMIVTRRATLSSPCRPPARASPPMVVPPRCIASALTNLGASCARAGGSVASSRASSRAVVA